MALWFTDGCAMTTTAIQKYPIFSAGQGSYVAAKGRFGGPGLQINAANFLGVPITSNPATFFTAFAFQVTSWPASGTALLWSAYDSVGAARQVYLAINTLGQLQFFLGNNSAIGPVSSQIFQPNTIYYLEIKVTIDPAAGLVECRLNGNTTPILSTGSVNTRNTANSFLNQSRLESGITSTYFSDVLMFDTTGSQPNTYQGNKKILTLLPANDSATGGLNQFSTSPSQTAGNHYKNVDEEPPDDDTSYNYDSSSTDRESYRFGSAPGNTVNIAVVNAWARARVDDAGPHTFQIGARSNLVDAFSGNFNPGASYAYFSNPFPTDPNTSAAWALAALNAAEFGVKMTG